MDPRAAPDAKSTPSDLGNQQLEPVASITIRTIWFFPYQKYTNQLGRLVGRKIQEPGYPKKHGLAQSISCGSGVWNHCTAGKAPAEPWPSRLRFYQNKSGAKNPRPVHPPLPPRPQRAERLRWAGQVGQRGYVHTGRDRISRRGHKTPRWHIAPAGPPCQRAREEAPPSRDMPGKRIATLHLEP